MRYLGSRPRHHASSGSRPQPPRPLHNRPTAPTGTLRRNFNNRRRVTHPPADLTDVRPATASTRPREPQPPPRGYGVGVPASTHVIGAASDVPAAALSVGSTIFDRGKILRGGSNDILLLIPNVETPTICDTDTGKILHLKVPVANQLLCPLCSQHFQAKEASKISICRHLALYHNCPDTKMVFECRFCNETSDSKYPLRALNMHAKKSHPGFTFEKPPALLFKCDQCEDSFSSQRGLMVRAR